MRNSDEVWDRVDRLAPEYVALADRVWGMPELAYTEHRSAAEHRAMLDAAGFRITEGIAGIPTALMGEAGEGGPVIAFLGEYDALPGLSQEAGLTEPKPVPGETRGHGCGHNLLGAGAMLAAAALKDWLAEHGIAGRVRYYGCPAEEGGAAKGFMARAGAFADVDVAISWHPSSFAAIWQPRTLANTRLDITFRGRASHAAASPHLGRSALDACELMNVGVNYMREHMPSDARIHYAYLDAGGIAPNVVQAHAKIRYLVRASSLPELNPLIARVRKIAEGAALMTECSVEVQVISAVSNLLANPPLEQALQAQLDRLGPPPFDEADRATAAAFQATMSEQDIAAAWRKAGMPPEPGMVLGERIVPLEVTEGDLPGSTDTGDVSWVVPTVQAWGATYAVGTPFHSWQMTAQGKLPSAHKGMVHVAKAMAATAAAVINEPALLARAKADHAARLAVTPYVCPIPPEVDPPLGMSVQA